MSGLVGGEFGERLGGENERRSGEGGEIVVEGSDGLGGVLVEVLRGSIG